MDFNKYKNEFGYGSQYSDWAKREGEIHQQFRDDALKEVGLEGHPRADKAYSYAWEKGHSAGFEEVFYYLKDIAEVIKDP